MDGRELFEAYAKLFKERHNTDVGYWGELQDQDRDVWNALAESLES